MRHKSSMKNIPEDNHKFNSLGATPDTGIEQKLKAFLPG